MFRFLRKIFFLLLFLATGYAVIRWDFGLWPGNFDTQKTPEVLPTRTIVQSSVPELTVLLVQVDIEEKERRVLRCASAGCQALRIPAEGPDKAVTDGLSWYHYVSDLDAKGKAIIRLARTWLANGQSDIIIEQTPLVEPRDLIISPDGSKVAYWLDNIADDADLTELWMFDAAAGGTRLLAEKLVAPDILTRVRWNRTGNMMWFLADSSPSQKPQEDRAKVELAVVDTNMNRLAARFQSIDWQTLKDTADRGIMDIDPTGTLLAYSKQVSREASDLVVVQDGQEPQSQLIRGMIPYIQWLEDGRLLYAIHNGGEIIFWQARGNQHLPIARVRGVLRSAQGDPGGTYVALTADVPSTHLYALDLTTGQAQDMGLVPAFGQQVHVVLAQPNQEEKSEVAGAISELSDGELIAFIDKHVAEMAGEPDAVARKIMITDRPNTVYIEAAIGYEKQERILVTIIDAVHPEWTIRARYEPAAGQWHKVQGAGGADPKPVRLYEWESSLEQWILKQRLDK